MKQDLHLLAKRIFLAAMFLLTAMGRPAFSEEQPYVLRVGDEVRITVFKEPDMSGVFKVSATGSVSVPGIGDIKTAGLNPDELRKATMQALSNLHYANPNVTVEIAQYSPVYIMGDVRNPGRQPYTPGITVLQLIALSGGYPMPLGFTESDGTAREVEKQRADLAISREKFASQSMKRARLLAERDNKPSFDAPAGLEAMVGKERLEQIVASEKLLMRARASEEEERVRLLRKQAAEIVNGRTALQGQLEATKRLKVIVDNELGNIRDLKERGLTANTRVLELERISADTEMRINNGISMISQSDQSLAGIDLVIGQAVEAARVKIAEELVDTEAELVVTNRQISSAVEFLNANGVSAPGTLAGQGEIGHRLTIARKGEPDPIAVSESTQVYPGDVLIVTRVMEAPSTGAALSTGSTNFAEAASLPPDSSGADARPSADRR